MAQGANNRRSVQEEKQKIKIEDIGEKKKQQIAMLTTSS